MRNIVWLLLFTTVSSLAKENEKIFPDADETTPSRSEYFSWINNTNEGTTTEQSLINLDFFRWLKDRYDMRLDIYAFGAGAKIDGQYIDCPDRAPSFKSNSWEVGVREVDLHPEVYISAYPIPFTKKRLILE